MQYTTSIKILRSYCGGEYHSSHLTQFLSNKGIHHQVSCLYTPQQNGRAERKHHHILETARALLHDASLPHTLWLHAVLTTIYLINRLPSPTTNHLSPYQLLHHTFPDYTHLRVFGCACYPHLPLTNRHKVAARSTPCTFLGYSTSSKGCLCLNSSTGHIITSRNVTFDEHHFPFKSTTPTISIPTSPPAPNPISPSLLLPTTLHVSHHPTRATPPPPLSAPPPSPAPSLNLQPTTPPLSSNQPNQPASPPIVPSHPMITRAQTGHLKPKHIFDLLHHHSSPDTPTSYSQAIKHPTWRQAMSQEFHTL